MRRLQLPLLLVQTKVDAEVKSSVESLDQKKKKSVASFESVTIGIVLIASIKNQK